MSGTLSSRKQDTKIVQMLYDFQTLLQDLRMNQNQKLQFIDITIDGTGTVGVITIGTGTTGIYIKARSGGGMDIFRSSDNTKIASLDTSGNLKTLGTITGNTTP